MIFIYKHSNLKNIKKMTLYFKRVDSNSKYIIFYRDEAIYNHYLEFHKI